MMDSEMAMRLLESGDADGVFASVLLLRVGENLWLSFDGEEWERLDSELIKKQF